jgi:hypothetical protein
MLHTVGHFHFFLPLTMCCSSTSPKCTAKKIVRVGFGLALAFVGFAHYQDAEFAESVGRGLNALEPIGMVWGYILPGLMILGGLLLAFGIYANVAAGIIAVALVSIPVGLMLKSAIGGIGLDVTMPAAMNAFVWIAVFLLVLRKSSCSGACAGCPCGMDNCSCPMPSDVKPAPVMKSAPVMPTVTKAPGMSKPVAKKMPVKKAPSKSKK